MKGFVAVLSLVLLALVCNSGALHVPAAGVAAAQECCVRNTDNASFQQFHDRDSIRQKKGQRHNRHSRGNPRCGLPCRRIGKGGASSVHIRGNGPFSPNFTAVSHLPHEQPDLLLYPRA